MTDPGTASPSETMTETTEPGAGSSGINASQPDYLKSGAVAFWSTAVVTLGLDQLTKVIIVQWSGFRMGMYPPMDGAVVIPGFFNLVYAINYGAAWGILQGYAWVLVALAVVVLALIYFFRKALFMEHPCNRWIFGLLTGGIIGNTTDRIFRGHVVDFLDFTLPYYRWPTFNIADSAIVIGTLWYLLLQIPFPRKGQASAN